MADDPVTPRGRSAVFLDRDDTLLLDHGYMNDPDRVELLPGAADALWSLQEAGFGLVLISNQSGVARGIITPEQVQGIQDMMCQLLPRTVFLGFEYCFHHPDDACGCRKPSPAMILRAAARLGLDLRRSVMVGDRDSDTGAGAAAGCMTVRICPDPVSCNDKNATVKVTDLVAAAAWIVDQAASRVSL